MEYKIIMKKDVHDKVKCLMHKIHEIDNGEEIGAWMLGEWKVDDESATLFIDGFHIPEQEVSSTEVDIGPESMISTLKELGNGTCNRIKAHWHIHPFGTGKTDWSHTDEEKIKDFMDPGKGRKAFVFVLSSEDWMKARLILNYKATNPLTGKDIIMTKSLDEMEVECEGEEENPLVAELKKEIQAKITRGTVTWNKKETTQTELVEEPFSVTYSSNEITVTLDAGFEEYIKMTKGCAFLGKADTTKFEGEMVELTFKLEKGQKPKKVTKVMYSELMRLCAEWEMSIEASECRGYNVNAYHYASDY